MARDSRDARLTDAVIAWFAANARSLPWRTTPRDPYRSLVSEIMAQQTQMSRVVERFEGFVRRFPTPGALARAREASVLAAWSGLGYYRRARLLQDAARVIVRELGGEIPSGASGLRALPGVGRYTAGAIASIVFGRREPIVDGNVARVLLRVEGKGLEHRRGMSWSWERAGELVSVARDPGAFNEGLMELGATVCTARAPACDRCPLADQCRARRAGTIGRIPSPKPAAARRTIHASVAIVRDARGRLLVERRGSHGLWAGLWQAPTLESERPVKSGMALAARLGVCGSGGWRRGERFEHVTTHRRVVFSAWTGSVAAGVSVGAGRAWKSEAQIARLGISSPQRRLLLGGVRPVAR